MTYTLPPDFEKRIKEIERDITYLTISVITLDIFVIILVIVK